MGIAAALQAIYRVVLAILGIAQSIFNAQQSQATSDAVAAIKAQTQDIFNLLTDTVVGLDAIQTALATITTDLTAGISVIEADIALVQQSGSPVTLPTTPPTGYGADPTGVASEVWGYSLPGSGQTAGDQQDNAGNLGRNLGAVGSMFRSYTSQWFTVGGTWSSNTGPDGYAADPIFPVGNILSTDTLSVFLERESFWTGWTDPTGSGYYRVAQGGGSDFYYETTITAAEFILLRDGPAALTGVHVPPVWPGLANITELTPVAMAPLVNIGTPCDGVITRFTAIPPRITWFTFPTENSYRHIGALAFYTDNGDDETPQNLGFEAAVYLPQFIEHPAGVEFRIAQGVEGTITPFTINPA